ncbi:recombinase family protein [Actinomadura sp. KC216]|uniref:recombinase family protein n=1 Tax=Actinomadura sp. KC216 TaxID=2530370 RepID=UPI0014052037|nr:recombinase family protein [Actinomadura sp. KC216]
MSSMPQNAGIYCRLSYAPDGSLEKVERQEADARRVADRLAWPISERHVFHDNNRSAWQRGRKRPGWDAMLAAIDAGEMDAIIVYHGDRLIRQPYDLETLLNISDSKGVRLASVSGVRNLDSPDDRFILRIEAAQACRASDDTSRRVRRGWEARARAGRPIGGGKRAFGFEPDNETRRESECAILAEAAERLLAGQTEGGVLRWMDTVCTTTQGNQWVGKALKNLMMAPRVAGLIHYQGVYYKATWDPIISPETWEDLKLLFQQRSEEFGYAGRERKHLLSGVARCPSGHGLRSKPAGGRNRPTTRIYWCAVRKCPTSVGRDMELLDAYVEGRVLALLNDEKFLAELHAADPSVAKELAQLERRKADAARQLEELVDNPDVDAGIVARSLAGFERKIRKLRDQAEASDRRRLLRRFAGIEREAWEDLSVDVRSSVVAATYRITVKPTTRRGPGFDPSAVDMVRLPLDDPGPAPVS